MEPFKPKDCFHPVLYRDFRDECPGLPRWNMQPSVVSSRRELRHKVSLQAEGIFDTPSKFGRSNLRRDATLSPVNGSSS
jgi:hypothetical protein